MVPHKTPRGAAALERLKVFEGVPPPFNMKKRVVIPEALRVLRLAPQRKYTVLKRLSSEFGWKYADVVEQLETKRKEKADKYYQTKKALVNKRKQAEKKAEKDLKDVNKKLAVYGY
jgi:large subunit ribosomal protein L13Ae